MNWMGIFFSFGIPVGIIIGMTAMLIYDRRKAKKRDKRCHQRIMNWWELEVNDER